MRCNGSSCSGTVVYSRLQPKPGRPAGASDESCLRRLPACVQTGTPLALGVMGDAVEDLTPETNELSVRSCVHKRRGNYVNRKGACILGLAKLLGWPHGVIVEHRSGLPLAVPGGEAGWRGWVDESWGSDEATSVYATLTWAKRMM